MIVAPGEFQWNVTALGVEFAVRKRSIATSPNSPSGLARFSSKRLNSNLLLEAREFMHGLWRSSRGHASGKGARALRCGAVAVGVVALCATGFRWESGGSKELPKAIRTIMEKPRYSEATWALRVTDVRSGEVIYDLNSRQRLLTGSVRKLYSVSDTLNRLGPDYRFKTPVYRRGEVDGSGDLKGDLILVAKGDLTMGGRDQGNDTLAISNFDHNDANNLGVGVLTAPDPLGGLNRLAKQVAASGITKVSGDVIIDDRLFKPFRVPNQKLLITPIIINDNRIDVTVLPTKPGERAKIEWRPHTAAFTVTQDVMTAAAGHETNIELMQSGPHAGHVSGQIAVDYKPPFPGVQTLVRTFSVDNPADTDSPASLQVPTEFARTTFIEALRRAGITVNAPLLGPNPARKLPPTRSLPGGYRGCHSGLRTLCAIFQAGPENKPQSRCQFKPDAVWFEPWGEHDTTGARGRAQDPDGTGWPGWRRILLPNQWQR